VTNRGSIQFKNVSPYQTLEISESAYGDDADLESVIGHNHSWICREAPAAMMNRLRR